MLTKLPRECTDGLDEFLESHDISYACGLAIESLLRHEMPTRKATGTKSYRAIIAFVVSCLYERRLLSIPEVSSIYGKKPDEMYRDIGYEMRLDQADFDQSYNRGNNADEVAISVLSEIMLSDFFVSFYGIDSPEAQRQPNLTKNDHFVREWVSDFVDAQLIRNSETFYGFCILMTKMGEALSSNVFGDRYSAFCPKMSKKDRERSLAAIRKVVNAHTGVNNHGPNADDEMIDKMQRSLLKDFLKLIGEHQRQR